MGCGCGVPTYNSMDELTGKDLLHDDSKRDTLIKTIYIDREKFANKDFGTLARFAWYADKEAFIEAFDRANVEVRSYEDVEKLVRAHEMGADKKGSLGLKFDTVEVFGKIDISLQKLANSGVKFSPIKE